MLPISHAIIRNDLGAAVSPRYLDVLRTLLIAHSEMRLVFDSWTTVKIYGVISISEHSSP